MMRAALLGSLLALCGCGVLRIQVDPTPDEVRWQGEITAAINEHSHRLEALERRCPTPTQGE